MKQKQYDRSVAAVFLAAFLLRYLVFGFRYYPILDDFIQYGGYPQYHDLSYVWFGIGTIATRPFAAFSDPVLWGGLWQHMGVALALITGLYFCAVLLFERTLSENGVRLSPLFWLIVSVLPIGWEGMYWISASSRIVVGLFFAALSLYALSRAQKSGKWLPFCLFALFHVLSCGYYEAVLIVSFLGAVGLIALHWKEEKHRVAYLAVPLVSLVLFLVYYRLAANIGAMGSRASGFALGGLFGKLADAANQVIWIFTKGMFRSLVLGFFAGLRVLLSLGIGGAFWFLAAAALSVFLGWLVFRAEPHEKSSWWLVAVGAVLFFAPLAPNVLVKTVWLPYRNLSVSLFGLALMAEPLFDRIVTKKLLRGALLAAALFVCLVAGVNEYDTYRRVSESDVRLTEELAERLDAAVLSGERNAVLILEREPIVEQTNVYKDHVKSVFDADWSLTGAVRAVTGNMKIKRITPVLSGKEEIADEQVFYLDSSGHITERNGSEHDGE